MKTHGVLAWQPRQDGSARFAVRAAPYVMVRVKRLLPRANPYQKGAVTVVDTPEVARDLEWLIGRYPLEMDEPTAARLAGRAEEHRRGEEEVERILAGRAPARDGLATPARAPRDYQLVAADLAAATGRLLLLDAIGLGKAQPLDARILTPHGFVQMGDIRIGDEVVASDGTATPVTAIHSQGERECFAVTFTDGSTVECDGEHLWRVSTRRFSRSRKDGRRLPYFWQTQTTLDLVRRGLRHSTGRAKWHIPMINASDLDDGGERKIDPYLLGALLGDGCFRSNGVSITTGDPELAAECARRVPEGVELRPRRRALYYFGRIAKSGSNPLVSELRSLGLLGCSSFTKFVPDSYLHASVADRLALLQGLMDTDGYAMPLSSGNASAFYYTSSRQLADAARWIVESLGGTGRLSQRTIAGKPRYTVTVKLPAPHNPFRLSRKAERWGNGHLTLRPTRAITAVKPIGAKPMQCITIEHPSHLYVTDRFVVTHNSMSSLLVLRDEELLPAVVVCYPHLERQWAEEVAECFPDLLVHAVKTMQPYDPALRRLDGRRPDVLIVPWSKLRGWGHHLRGQARTVVFDEAQELRTGPAASQKYRAAAEIAADAACSLELTATPVYNYGGEIFNLVHAIAPDVLGGRDEFMREWCGSDDGAARRALVRDPAGLGEYLRDQGVMLRRSRRDVGRELPATERIPHVVAFDEAVMDKGDHEVVQLADVVLARQAPKGERFLAAGELDWRLRRLTGLAKAPYVAAFVEALLEQEDDKIVLYGWHHDVYDQWRMRLAPHRPAFYTGAESKSAKQRSFDEFVRGDARVLIVSLRAGAGLDGLQGASHTCVFGELDWSPGVHEQCIGRLERDGMGEHVTAFFLVAEAGSDPVILETLGLKRSQSEPLVDPDADPFAPVAHDEARVVRLAEYVRARRHGR